MQPISTGLENRSGTVLLIAALLGILLIVALRYTLSPWWAQVLLNYYEPRDELPAGLRKIKEALFPLPYSVQNMMWIAFAVGLGQLTIRFSSARAEMRQLKMTYLPEDPRVILQSADLPEIYRKLRSSAFRDRCFLPRLIDRCILQFQASRSTAQSASLLNTSVEMFLHEVDLRYNMLRYLCWLIPSLGFIGTVIGIGGALEWAGQSTPDNKKLLNEVTELLSVSFNGTFLALVLASVLVFLQNRIQEKEEHALNQGAQYCLDNLINRLYVEEISS